LQERRSPGVIVHHIPTGFQGSSLDVLHDNVKLVVVSESKVYAWDEDICVFSNEVHTVDFGGVNTKTVFDNKVVSDFDDL
jgi:hypothetical protein